MLLSGDSDYRRREMYAHKKDRAASWLLKASREKSSESHLSDWE